MAFRGSVAATDCYLREIAWREFAHHLLYHFPHTPDAPLKDAYADFPWNERSGHLEAWQRGMTGFPIVKSKTVAESKGRQSIKRPDAAATFTELPLTDLNAINVLVVQADQATTVRLNDQSDAGIPLNANGLMILFDSDIPSGATLKAALENGSGSEATVLLIAGGD